MLVNIQEAVEKDYDLIVVGSGPAGLVLADHASKKNLRVLMIEKGGTHPEIGKYNDIHFNDLIRDDSLNQGVGGNSNFWGGLISLMDASDFARINPSTGKPYWPITFVEIKGFYDEVAKLYNFPETSNFSLIKKCSDSIDKNLISIKRFIGSYPPNSFKDIVPVLNKNCPIDLVTNSEVEKLISNNKDIVKIVLKDNQGEKHTINCTCNVVLACNTVGNTRVLLNSGFGKNKKISKVGKFYTNHPKGSIAECSCIKFELKANDFFGKLSRGQSTFIGFKSPEDKLITGQISNNVIRLEPILSWSKCDAVENLLLFVKRIKILNLIIKRLSYKRELGVGHSSEYERDKGVTFLKLLSSILKCPLQFGKYLLFRLGLISGNPQGVKFSFYSEILPLETNRLEYNLVGASKKKKLHCSDFSKSISYSDIKLLAQSVYNSDIFDDVCQNKGPLFVYPNLKIKKLDASHPAGTTRMGYSSDDSVVDKNLKLHGISNLYILGASVFPTSGHANPVFTIMALALRLSKFLTRMSKEK